MEATKQTFPSLDSFTRAYITTALWSTTLPPFSECPCCGKRAVLDRWDEGCKPVCADCSTREPNHEPPAEDNYDFTDFAPETLARIVEDCRKFQESAAAVLQAAIATGEVVCGPDFDETERAGHDFWLTREGHGAGFWDGDWPEPFSDTLTDCAKSYGSFNLYVGDDGKIHN